jgi:hypothetical protein
LKGTALAVPPGSARKRGFSRRGKVLKPAREHATNNAQTYFVTSDTWERRPLFRAESWARLFLKTLQLYRGDGFSGTTEVVPFQNYDATTGASEVAPFQSHDAKDGTTEVVPFQNGSDSRDSDEAVYLEGIARRNS